METIHEEMAEFHEQMADVHIDMEPIHAQMEKIHVDMEPFHEQMEQLHVELEPFHEEMERLGDRLEKAIQGRGRLLPPQRARRRHLTRRAPSTKRQRASSMTPTSTSTTAS